MLQNLKKLEDSGMKITLQVNGREMTFSEQELTSILEEHFSSKTTQKITTAKVTQSPTENVWFEVKPQSIDQELFKSKRENKRQEVARQLILEAFIKMRNNPARYGKNFKTMMPKKTWKYASIPSLLREANKLGDHNADWVEQALEWAQRIANGESWETICNNRDTANWYRLVGWKKGCTWRLVGGSVCRNVGCPAADVSRRDASYFYDEEYLYLHEEGVLYNVVPLVVSYE